MTRGQRNNNPLNIRLCNTYIWRGQVRNPREKQFVTFDTLTNGFRAAIKTIRTYMDVHHLHTLEAICHRWAPPTENNTHNYVLVVSKFSGIPKDAAIDFTDEDTVIRLVDAMAFMENGIFFNKDVIKKAYQLVAAESAGK